MKKNKNIPMIVAFTSVCIVLNIMASFLAITLRLPVYLDTTGTILTAAVLGGPWAIICALLSSLLNASYDAFAIPFAPQGVTTAIVSTFLFHHAKTIKWTPVLKGLIIGFFAAVVGASIAAYIFDGVTSAGSSYLVQFFHQGLGLPLVATTFVIQWLTDSLDKVLIVIFVSVLMKRLPQSFIEKFWKM